MPAIILALPPKSSQQEADGLSRPYRRGVKLNMHGKSHTPEYYIWKGVKQRCRDKNCAAYKNYGARGIKICEKWERFENFLNDMGPRPSSRHSIDRMNGAGDYEPSNCRWATNVEQNNNRSTARRITLNGREMTLYEAIKVSGADLLVDQVRVRLDAGWSIEDALRRPLRKQRNNRYDRSAER